MPFITRSEINPKKQKKRIEDEGGGLNDDRSPAVANEEDEEDLRAQVLNDIDEEDLLHMKIPPKPEPVMSSDGSGQRLVIHSIEVENFKSYYGKHVLGPFHHNLSAIIGPNGSGKSNVIDSLLFVFGYRASKIRSKKISVLIHSSKGNENLQSCTVCVNFQKIIDRPDGTFDLVEGSQFKVTRTAYKDNSSKYTYNGKAMQFKDIAKRLREVGIDLIHNRFLILQGEVEQIAMMKPKALTENDDGMLEYLEDIIGSSRLKIPIEKLQKKIESLQEERTAQLTRVKMAEKEKNELEGPVKGIVMELRIDNGIALCRNRLLQVEKVGAVSALDMEEEERKKIVDELDDAKRLQKEMTEARSSGKKELEALQLELERAQEAYERAKKEIAENDQARGKRKAELARLVDKKKKLLEDIKKETKKVDDLEGVPAKAKAKIDEYEQVLADIDEVINERKAKADEKLAEFAEKTQELQAKKKVEEEKLGKLATKEDEAAAKLTLAQEALQQLRCDEEKERKKLSDLKDSLDEARNTLETKKSDLVKACKVLPNLEEEMQMGKAELSAKREEEAECAENVRSSRAKFEHKRQAVEAHRSQNNLLNRLMHEKATGAIPGIFGRLGDLGAIDQKYDVAISTTCGALDYIVVDTVETAQQCVEVLKRDHLGVASFIALDKQEKLRPLMAKPDHTPENVPRLFDLIRVADRAVLPAFYYALRDTLVADDIATATRVGVGGRERHRVVTLKGEVVEPSGTMTGGGRSEQRGRIGQDIKVDTSKDSAKEIAALQNYLDEEQERLVDIRRSIQQLEKRLNSVKTDYDRVKRNEQNLKTDIGPLEEKIEGLEKRLKEQKVRAKEAAADERAVEKAKQKVAELEKERNAAAEVADEVREQVAEVSAKIQAVYAELVEPFKRQLDEALARKESASKGIAKEKGAVNNAERNLNKAKARKNDLEADLKETEEAIEKIHLNADNHVQRMEELMKQKSERQEELKEAESRLKEVSNKFSQLDNEEVDLQRKVNELQRVIESKEGDIAHAKAKVTSIVSKLSSLHLDYVKCIKRLPEHLCEVSDEDDFSLQEAIENERVFIRKLTEGEIMAEADKTGIIQINDLPIYSADQIENFNINDIRFTLANLEKRKAGKAPNLSSLQEYIHKLERYDKEVDRLKEISIKKDQHRDLCEELRSLRLKEFMEGFTQIGVALKEMYQMITLGGDASLDLVDSLDPFSEGVSFGVRPPKKSWKQITNLSGGEKTLSSLALVFALHHYRPTPLYVMDEIDAALDFRNVSIIAHYIKDRTKNAQFIIISLRNNMFELGDRLVGIYKTFDCTKNVLVEASLICENMRNQRAVLDALEKVKLNQEDRASLQASRGVDKAAAVAQVRTGVSDERLDENEEPEVPRGASDDSGSVRLSVAEPCLRSPVESSGARILDIPAFKGTRKALSPDRKRQVADFVKYVERTKKLAEPVAPLEKESSVSPPTKKQRSPRKKSCQEDKSENRRNSSGTERKRSPRKSRRAAAFTKPIVDLETSGETLSGSPMQSEVNRSGESSFNVSDA
uniref:Structural maintenance of chromosomes protein n=1 Tax=Ascaris suum TaxID=6253 RepID=F1KR40_ASCSU